MGPDHHRWVRECDFRLKSGRKRRRWRCERCRRVAEADATQERPRPGLGALVVDGIRIGSVALLQTRSCALRPMYSLESLKQFAARGRERGYHGFFVHGPVSGLLPMPLCKGVTVRRTHPHKHRWIVSDIGARAGDRKRWRCIRCGLEAETCQSAGHPSTQRALRFLRLPGERWRPLDGLCPPCQSNVDAPDNVCHR